VSLPGSGSPPAEQAAQDTAEVCSAGALALLQPAQQAAEQSAQVRPAGAGRLGVRG
jgi:hypothetical protein